MSCAHCLQAEVRLYDRLWKVENPRDELAAIREEKNCDALTAMKEMINPDSLNVLPCCYIEKFAAGMKPLSYLQFQRIGYFNVDRDRAKFLGIPLTDIFSTMKAYLGSVYVNDFNMFNRIYKVYIQAEAPYREHKENINLFFVKAANGAMVPLTSLGNASYTTGPGSIKRFNMFTTAVFRGEAAQGYSSGQAMEIMEQIARNHLPDNIGLEWSGLSYQEKKAGGQTGLVLTLVFLFVFLFLAAQYESWTVPIAVLLSLPVAALGAYRGAL